MVLGIVEHSSGIDVALLPVADGSQNAFLEDGTATSSRLHAEYAEGFTRGRRIVMKFDLRGMGSFEPRSMQIHLFGGCGSAGPGPVNTRVYRYSNNDWHDASNASVPFPADGSCSYLAQKDIANVLTSDYIGSSLWHVFDIGPNIGPLSPDGFLSLAVRNFNPAFESNVSFVSRNSVTWDGSKGREPRLVVSSWRMPGIKSGSFPDVDLTDWIVIQTAGSARTVVNPRDPDDRLAELVTGSPVSIAQRVDTPKQAFAVAFDYEFRTVTGTLAVRLENRQGEILELGGLVAGDSPADAMTRTLLVVEDPAWYGLDHALISFTLDGSAGSRLWLNNISFEEPAPPRLPTLRIVFGHGDQVVLAWPEDQSGWVLQENAAPEKDGWIDITIAPELAEGEWRVSLERPHERMFFRLSHP